LTGLYYRSGLLAGGRNNGLALWILFAMKACSGWSF